MFGIALLLWIHTRLALRAAIFLSIAAGLLTLTLTLTAPSAAVVRRTWVSCGWAEVYFLFGAREAGYQCLLMRVCLVYHLAGRMRSWVVAALAS